MAGSGTPSRVAARLDRTYGPSRIALTSWAGAAQLQPVSVRKLVAGGQTILQQGIVAANRLPADIAAAVMAFLDELNTRTEHAKIKSLRVTPARLAPLLVPLLPSAASKASQPA